MAMNDFSVLITLINTFNVNNSIKVGRKVYFLPIKLALEILHLLRNLWGAQ